MVFIGRAGHGNYISSKPARQHAPLRPCISAQSQCSVDSKWSVFSSTSSCSSMSLDSKSSLTSIDSDASSLSSVSSLSSASSASSACSYQSYPQPKTSRAPPKYRSGRGGYGNITRLSGLQMNHLRQQQQQQQQQQLLSDSQYTTLKNNPAHALDPVSPRSSQKQKTKLTTGRGGYGNILAAKTK